MNVHMTKIMSLHECLAFLYSGRPPLDDGKYEASHLCGNPACTVFGHVVWESKADNLSRKRCPVWVDSECCNASCTKKVLLCPHRPPCIKPIPGTNSDEYLNKPAACFKNASGCPLEYTSPLDAISRLLEDCRDHFAASVFDSLQNKVRKALRQVGNKKTRMPSDDSGSIRYAWKGMYFD